MVNGDYEKTNLRFPVMGTDGKFHDIFGYTECYWDCNFFFFHLADDSAVVYKTVPYGFSGELPRFDYWSEVTEKWLVDQKKYWGEKRFHDNFCPPISLNVELIGWRIKYQSAYDYTAYNDDGEVIHVNFREGRIVQYKLPGEGTIRYYFPSLLEAFITEDGYLISKKKDLHMLGRLNLEATLNCRGYYFIFEDGTVYKETCLWNYTCGNYGLLPELKKAQNGCLGNDYIAFHYADNTVEITTSHFKKYMPLKRENIRKTLFTNSHIVFLHDDGHVSYSGQNKNRSCSGLEKYSGVKDIWGTNESTTLLLENGEEIHIPKR